MTDAPREYRQVRFELPPTATELLLVRHGESAALRDGEPMAMLGTQGDPPLDPRGHEQAERVADRLAAEQIAAIYVTPLQRTAQTAAPLAERTGLVPVVEPDLREVFLGEWEGGGFRRHVAAGHPIAARMREEERWDVIPGAEPAADFSARVRRAVLRLAERHRGEAVVVVVHGGVIGEILAQASGSRAFAFGGADNGSVSHVVIDGDRWIVRRFNDTAHLQLAFTTRPEPLT